MEVFEQMIYYIRSIQRLDNYLKYQNKKLDWIVHFKPVNKEYIFNHPIRKNLNSQDLQILSDRCEKVTYGVTHNFIWPYDKNTKDYTYAIVTDYCDLLKFKILKTPFAENLNELMHKNKAHSTQELQSFFENITKKLNTNPNFETLNSGIIFLNTILKADRNKPESQIASIEQYIETLKNSNKPLIQQQLKDMEENFKSRDLEILNNLHMEINIIPLLDKYLEQLEKHSQTAELFEEIAPLYNQRINDINNVIRIIAELLKRKNAMENLQGDAIFDEIKIFLEFCNTIVPGPNGRNIITLVTDYFKNYFKNYFKANVNPEVETKGNE